MEDEIINTSAGARKRKHEGDRQTVGAFDVLRDETHCGNQNYFLRELADRCQLGAVQVTVGGNKATLPPGKGSSILLEAVILRS